MSHHTTLLISFVATSFLLTIASAQLITVCGGASITFPCQNGGACASNQWTFQRCNLTTGTFEIIDPEGNCGLTMQDQMTVGIAVGVGGAAALALSLGLGIGIPAYKKKQKSMKDDMTEAMKKVNTKNPVQNNSDESDE